MQKKEILKLIEAQLSADKRIQFAILFGSLADGTFNDDSDIDIAIQSSPKFTKKEIFSLRLLLEKLTSRDVDLVDINQSTSMILLNQIATKGKTLFTKDPRKLDELLITLPQMYIDFRRTRAALEKAYIDRKLND